MRKAKLFVINTIILTATSFIIRIIGMSFNVYVSNKVGAECIGLFQLIMSIYIFAITLATSGISIAATRLVTEELSRKNNKGAKIIISKCILYSLLLGITSSVLILLFSDFIVEVCLHNKISKMPLIAISIGLPFIAVSSAINGYFAAVRKVIKTASSQILEQLVKIIATSFLLSLFLPKGIEYACLSLIIGDVISEVISFTYIFILYIYDKRKINSSNVTSRNYRKDILNISIPIALTSYIRSFLSTLKQLIIPIRLEKSGMSCKSALESYGIISGMALPLLLFPNVIIVSISNLLIPEYSTFYATNETEKISKISTKILKLTFIFAICMFGIFLTFSDLLCNFIYNDARVIHFVKILSPLLILMYIDNIVDGMLKGLNKQVAVMKCNILDLFVSTTLLYILLPIIQINGYIIVLYISEILNTVISIIQLKKVSKFRIKYFSWLLIPLSGILLCRYIIKFLNFSTSNIFTLIMQILLFIFIYISFLVFSLCLKKEDIKV